MEFEAILSTLASLQYIIIRAFVVVNENLKVTCFGQAIRYWFKDFYWDIFAFSYLLLQSFL